MPTATSTLDTLGTAIINTVVSLATTVITVYWPYILVFGVVIGLIVFGKRLIGITHR